MCVRFNQSIVYFVADQIINN